MLLKPIKPVTFQPTLAGEPCGVTFTIQPINVADAYELMQEYIPEAKEGSEVSVRPEFVDRMVELTCTKIEGLDIEDDDGVIRPITDIKEFIALKNTLLGHDLDVANIFSQLVEKVTQTCFLALPNKRGSVAPSSGSKPQKSKKPPAQEVAAESSTKKKTKT